MSRALDTDEPQGSSPSSSVPAVSPLNLDRLAQEAEGGLEYEAAHPGCRALSAIRAADVLALVARVRALEAALTHVLEWPLPEGTVETWALPEWLADEARSALAVVDGGGTDG